MNVREAGQARHFLVEARVVLHRARAEREQPHVDGEVLAAEARVVADDLGLRQTREADYLAFEAAEAGGDLRGRRQIDAGARAVADLEDQRLLKREAPVAGEGLDLAARGGIRRGFAALAVQHDTASS